MADQTQQIEDKEKAEKAPEAAKAPEQAEAPKGLDTSRKDIAGALETGEEGAEAGGEMVETGERVSEVAAEGRERKGAAMAGKKKKDEGKKAKAAAVTFTFDESNLPPAPVMIKRIENQLRKDIHQLEKRARRFQGGLFRKADYPQYSETMGEIRRKTVILRRLVTMATDLIKKMFIQMFAPKKVK